MNSSVLVMVEAAQPKIIEPEMPAPTASAAMTFECPDCGRERFNPYGVAPGMAVAAGPCNVLALLLRRRLHRAVRSMIGILLSLAALGLAVPAGRVIGLIP